MPTILARQPQQSPSRANAPLRPSSHRAAGIHTSVPAASRAQIRKLLPTGRDELACDGRID